jgi:hypothetical protein
MSLSTKRTVFWNVTPYSLAQDYQVFVETYCIHLQSRRVKEAINKNSAWFLLIASSSYFLALKMEELRSYETLINLEYTLSHLSK